VALEGDGAVAEQADAAGGFGWPGVKSWFERKKPDVFRKINI
jgi:hypothetical protein